MFPGGGGMEDNVMVNIGGNSMGLVDALATSTEAMARTAQASEALAGAFGSLSAAGGADVGAFAEAGTAANELGARYDALAMQTRAAAQAQAQMAGMVGGSSAGGGFLAGMMGSAGGLLGGEGLIGLMGGLGDAIGTVINPMMGFVKQAGAMVTGLIGFSVLNDVIQEVQQFTTSLIDLNIQIEKNQYAWRYLYGGGNTPQGAAVAQQMADWTRSFSMQIPYTRQDLLSAITNLAPTGLSAQGLEHYMPLIADLAATRDPNATLSRVAQVIMSASMGYTRMLKYDLKINPEELIKYGLDATGTGMGIHINDASTLLPALENYAKAKHLTGAAKDISHETWWGAWSSFIDRIQNFELDTGKGLFGSLKKALVDLSSWIDTHADQISRFSDLIGTTLANAFKGLTGIIGDFLTGVGQSGLWDFLHAATGAGGTPTTNIYGTNVKGGSDKAGKMPHDTTPVPHTETHTALNVLRSKPPDPSGWQKAGEIIGKALQMIAQGWDEVSKAWSPAVSLAMSDLSKAWTDFTNSLTPDDKEALKQIGEILLSIPWATIAGAVWLLAVSLEGLSFWLKNVINPIHEFFRHVREGTTGLKDQLAKWKTDVTQWADGLKTNFLTWGTDFITNLATGMQTAATSILQPVATGIAGALKGIFGHSAPTAGPLVGDDQWMPDMMRLFARGISENTSLLADAATGAAAAMAGSMRPAGGYRGMGAGSAGGGPVTLVINGSSTLETMKLIDYVLSRQDAHVNLATRASSGFGGYQFGTLGNIR